MDVDEGGVAETSAYAWEEGFERAWDGVQEDEDGNILTVSAEQPRARRRYEAQGVAIKRGMIRYVFLCVDMSRAMSELDMRPSRLAVVTSAVKEFVGHYFEQNPLSQLGIIVTRDGQAIKLTDLSGNPKSHVDALEHSMELKGEASLENILKLGCTSLRTVPDYGNREMAAELRVRISVIIMGAETYITHKMTEATDGDYVVAKNGDHFKAAVLAQCIPPPSISRQGAHYAQMVEMGFPRRHDLLPSLGYNGRQQTLTPSGYFCPRCKTKSTELPSTCTVCALPLVSSPHLARSYHHLFPVPPYKELEMGKETDASLRVECCAGCLADISQSVQYRCGDCRKCFCNDCDIYIHDVLFNCPGC